MYQVENWPKVNYSIQECYLDDESTEIQENDCSADLDGSHFWRVCDGEGHTVGVAGQVLVFDMSSCCKAAYLTVIY